MPIYMDFHDLPDGVTAEHVAQMHQADLELEHKYKCRGLTYWCDEIRHTAFCLIEAPNKEAINELHENAHGGVPNQIIEVNDVIVESFLGRIKDPDTSNTGELPVVDESAFRILLLLQIHRKSLRGERAARETLKAALRGYARSIKSIVSKQQGRLVSQDTFEYLISFQSATGAINAATEMIELHNAVITPDLEFNIGICGGNPVTSANTIFEETINNVRYYSGIAYHHIVISQEVQRLYDQEMHRALPQFVDVLSPTDQSFLVKLMEYLDRVWGQANVLARDMHHDLGFSKSGLYRMITRITGFSPQQLLKQYRLQKALHMLDTKEKQIAEVAYACGFSSPAYFSRSFQDAFKILPSVYLKH